MGYFVPGSRLRVRPGRPHRGRLPQSPSNNMAQKKQPAKKAGKKSPKQPAARSAGKKPAARKSAAKKSAAKAPTAKKGAAKKGAAKKAGAKKAVSKGASGRAARSADPVAQIQRVIDVMVEAGAVEVELEDAGLKLRVRLKGDVSMPMMPYAAPAPAPVMGAAPAAPAVEGGAAAAPAADDPRRKVFQSPMVGTFYRSSSPDSDPFASVGDRVGPDQTICILEAMKVMNEIKAEMSGEIVEVLVENGEPVEFGQPLFVIKAD